VLLRGLATRFGAGKAERCREPALKGFEVQWNGNVR